MKIHLNIISKSWSVSIFGSIHLFKLMWRGGRRRTESCFVSMCVWSCLLWASSYVLLSFSSYPNRFFFLTFFPGYIVPLSVVLLKFLTLCIDRNSLLFWSIASKYLFRIVHLASDDDVPERQPLFCTSEFPPTMHEASCFTFSKLWCGF